MKLIDRINWSQQNLERVEPQYCIPYVRPGTGATSVCHPAPEWLAMAMHGDLLPDIEVYHQLRCEWTHEETGEVVETLVNEAPEGTGWKGGKVLNGHLLHEGPRAPAMTEEEAMEYLLQKDVPRAVWADHETANTPRFYIIRRDQLPATRQFRNSWILNPDLEKAA